MLLSKTVMIKWHGFIKQWYLDRGYIFTKMKDEFEVKVEDLSKGSNTLVEVECDNCRKVKHISWNNYRECVHEDETYYCHNCAVKLFVGAKRSKNKLKNGENSFAQYLINLYGENALNLYWDYDKNININPWEINKSCNKPQIFIKCQKKDYHESYVTTCNNFSNSQRCSYCATFHGKVHPLDSLGKLLEDKGLLKLWSNKNKKSPYEYTPMSSQKVWWKCPDGKHEDYHRNIDDSNACNFKCPKCDNLRKKGKTSPSWKGGITPLQNYLRTIISSWKIDSFKAYNNTCCITGKKSKENLIHHKYGFHKIVKETMEILNLPIYQEISEYTKEELKLIEDKCLELHYEYGLGVCICKDIHNQFHKIYGRKNNTPEQWNEFEKIYNVQ